MITSERNRPQCELRLHGKQGRTNSSAHDFELEVERSFLLSSLLFRMDQYRTGGPPMTWSSVLLGLQSLSHTHARTGEEVQSRQAGFEDPWVPFVPMCPIPSSVSLLLIYQAQTVLFRVPKNLVRETGPQSARRVE